MDLALNNLQRLICHKTKQTKPKHILEKFLFWWIHVIFHVITPALILYNFYAKSTLSMLCQQSLEYTKCIPSRRDKNAKKNKKRFPRYGTKLHPGVRLQFWSSGECRVTFLDAITPRSILTQSGSTC